MLKKNNFFLSIYALEGGLLYINLVSCFKIHQMETYLVHPDKWQEKALEVPYEVKGEESLPVHVIKGIKKGQEDIKAGRAISLEEFKTRIA